MFSIILTWIGALLGMTVLLAMAFGAFVVDLDDALGGRTPRTPEHRETPDPAAPTA